MSTKLLPLFLSGCLLERTDLTTAETNKCSAEISSLKESCQARNGTFNKAVDDFKACIGEEVRVTCSWGDSFEHDILTIDKL